MSIFHSIPLGVVSASPSWTPPIPTPKDALFYLDGSIKIIGSDYYFEDKSGNNKHFLITGIDWIDDTRVYNLLPFKTFATISAPAGDADLIVADVDNFLYAGDGTPNEITPQMLFQNIDYKDKLFCRHVDHVLNADNTEFIYSGVKDIALYSSVRTGADLTACNTYFAVPIKLTSNVIWISPDGNDSSGNGSETTPYLTVQKALTQISAGQNKVIYMKGGLYTLATVGYDYLNLASTNYTVTFKGIGRVIWTATSVVNAVNISTSSGCYNFERIQVEGTFSTALSLYNTSGLQQNVKYVNIPATCSVSKLYGTNIITEKCKINGLWNMSSYPLQGIVNDCIIKNRGVTYTNSNIETCKTIIEYNKLIETIEEYPVAVYGTWFDYCYNVSFISNIAQELYGGYVNTDSGKVNIHHNIHYITGAIYNLISFNLTDIATELSCCYNKIYHNSLNYSCEYLSTPKVGKITFEHNIINSNSKVGFSAIKCNPFTDCPCAISIKYNTVLTKSTVLGAIINFTESAAFSGGVPVFNGAEIMYNYVTGGNVDYPEEIQNAHAVLARSGNDMKIAYNLIKNCAIGIVMKNETIANTSGGIYGNLLIDNRVSIYLGYANNSFIYNNTFYQTADYTAWRNSYFIDIRYSTYRTYITNNIMYRQSTAHDNPNMCLFGADQETILSTHIDNNVIYSDTDQSLFITDRYQNYSVSEALALGYASDIISSDPGISSLVPYPVTPIKNATVLGAEYANGLDISSIWTEGVILKAQEDTWEFGAYVQWWNPLTPIPDIPTNLVCSLVNSDILLTWGTNTYTTSIERSLTGNSGWSEIHVTLLGENTWKDITTNSNTLYYYRLRSFNLSGYSDYSNIDSETSGSHLPASLTDTSKTVGWYDFSLGITKDGSDNISAWNDQSGANHHFSCPTNKPKYTTNGVQMLSSVKDFKTGAFTFVQPEYLYLVINIDSWESNTCIIDGITAYKAFLYQDTSTPNISIYAGVQSLKTDKLTVGSWHILRVFIKSGGNGKIQVDSETALVGDFGSEDMGGIWLGSVLGSSTSYHLKELIAQKSDDETNILAYLKAKYSL